jgi:hypothetical protein
MISSVGVTGQGNRIRRRLQVDLEFKESHGGKHRLKAKREK